MSHAVKQKKVHCKITLNQSLRLDYFPAAPMELEEYDHNQLKFKYFLKQRVLRVLVFLYMMPEITRLL